jgi:hypothetical protein
VRKLYSSSTRFRPPLIPDSTRNHPPAMNSRNTCTRFAQHLDTLPFWILSGIWSSLPGRPDIRHGYLHECHGTLEHDRIPDLVSTGARRIRSHVRRPSILDEGNVSRYPFNTNENVDISFASPNYLFPIFIKGELPTPKPISPPPPIPCTTTATTTTTVIVILVIAPSIIPHHPSP